MFRFLFRLVILAVVLGVVAVVVLRSGWVGTFGERETTVGTSGSIDTARAREAGAEIAERVAEGATRAEAALAEARLTAKIKSKIALDDTLAGSRVDVDTNGTIVTVKGRVTSGAQRQRVVQLAKETSGVTSVVDRLELESR
jgi:osmotically-inducible protein OsmY